MAAAGHAAQLRRDHAQHLVAHVVAMGIVENERSTSAMANDVIRPMRCSFSFSARRPGSPVSSSRNAMWNPSWASEMHSEVSAAADISASSPDAARRAAAPGHADEAQPLAGLLRTAIAQHSRVSVRPVASSAASASTGTPRRASAPCTASVLKKSAVPSLLASAMAAAPEAIRPSRAARSSNAGRSALRH